MAENRCVFPKGFALKLDGIHDASPHAFQLREVHENVTVILSKCVRCGKTEISWKKQPNTESEYIGERIKDSEFPEGPDGCLYKAETVYRNAIVKVLVCKNCGLMSFAWEITPETYEDELHDE